MATIQNLEEQIVKAAEAYYLGEAPIMSDAEFDRTVEELRAMCPTSKVLVQVGWGMKVYKNKVSLPVAIRNSLDKVQFKDLKEEGVRVYSPKVDGMSCVLQYQEGKLVIAATRGDGEFGIDFTPKTSRMRIPHSLNTKLDLIVKGELFIYTDVFEEKLSGEYENPRNAVAGIVNSKNFNNLEYVRFAAHPQGMVVDLPQEDRFELGLLPTDVSDDKSFLLKLREEWLKAGYPMDGIVSQSYDDFNERRINNIYAIKFETEEVLTTVVDVIWSERTSGRMCPTIKYEPVRLYGTTCENCSGSSYDYIKTNKIGKGAKVMLT
jgi:DNA ligase (NAD+)